MSYFSALARQSGIRVGGQTLLPRAAKSAVSPIEVEETRVAPEPVRPAMAGQPPRPASPPSVVPARSVPPVRPPDEPPPAPTRAPDVNADTPAPPPARLESVENFTLDIGAIAITFDAPAPASPAPAPVRPASPASKPSPSGRASRHYLRI